MQWFRAYGDMVDDAKLKLLAHEDRWRFVAILCCKAQGILDMPIPQFLDRMVADKLGLTLSESAEVKRRLMEVHLIADNWQPLAWDRRQYKSDDSYSRVKKFRDQKKEIKKKTDTETDTYPSVTETFQERFTEFKETYPQRAGSNPWGKAEKAIHARLSEGSTWDEILEGTRRYASFCAATQKARTEFVLQASTFCGPDKRYLEDWALPATKADNRLASNLDAAADFLRRTNETQ